MRYLRWGFWLVIASLVFAFLHYTLPQRDIVFIVGTESRRVDIGENSLFWSRAEVGMSNTTSRDVFFINAVRANGRTVEYRNEDTGWGWPPYFKIDSYGLDTQAKRLISTEANPVWVAVTHYGWRNQFFTIFPNAVSIRRVEGPDVTLIPWVNIAILGTLLLVLVMIRRMWLQFRERMIEPTIDRLDARADAARAEARGAWGRFTRWIDSWRSKPKR
ncbi:DUF1523 family protein [Pseudogemmobacter sonorensis]|uniref:DUF1523 family protein n=1 Tax=Pseudogemmobacter sonorensis TaxID=2989681 RepID=UPI0036AB241F